MKHWALITGASSGLGAEFARLCAEEGYNVAVVARRKDRLEKLCAELKRDFPDTETLVIEADLSAPGTAKKVAAPMLERRSQFEVLINNAGVGSAGSFSSLSLEKELQMVQLNVTALTELTGLLLPVLLKNKSGYILNVGSTAGFQPGPFMATYYATKAYVNSWSEALYEELKGTGVSCTVLAPGATATEFATKAGNDKSRLFQRSGVATSKNVAAAGYRAMKARKALCVSGATNQMMVQSLRLSPRAATRKIAAYFNQGA